MELLATGHWKPETDLWRIKKDKAPHETGATRTRSGLASRLSEGSSCRAAPFAKITGRIKFLDKGSMGKFVMVEPEAIEAK